MTVMQITRLTPSEVVDSVLQRYRTEGGRRHTPSVTHVEHAAQSAAFARRAGLAPPLVAACLLHDYGRLLGGSCADHAEVGADALMEVFGPAVTEPIRLHSQAWRYLAAVEPDFVLAAPPPVLGLEAAWPEPMSGRELRAFLELPWAEEAATIRRIDEASRLPGIDSPPLEQFRPLLEGLAIRR